MADRSEDERFPVELPADADESSPTFEQAWKAAEEEYDDIGGPDRPTEWEPPERQFPMDRLVTFKEARQRGAYGLAEMYGQRPWRFALTDEELDLTDQLEELAVMSALAETITGWLGLQIDQAVRAGATPKEIARALLEYPQSSTQDDGQAEVARVWHRWAAGQRSLAEQYADDPEFQPGLTAERYEQVYAVLGHHLYCEETQFQPTHRGLCARCGQAREDHHGTAEGWK